MPATNLPDPALVRLHGSFRQALPAIQRIAFRVFRRVRCPHERADLVSEAVALCWACFLAVPSGSQSFAVHLVAARAVQAVHARRRIADLHVHESLPAAV